MSQTPQEAISTKADLLLLIVAQWWFASLLIKLLMVVIAKLSSYHIMQKILVGKTWQSSHNKILVSKI